MATGRPLAARVRGFWNAEVMSDPCAAVTTVAPDGARVTGCAHGGQLLGWVPAGSDQDRLWLSPTAQCGPGKSVRGGVPVVFPQFSDRGPLPKHGFVRDREWEVLDGSEPGRFVSRLGDDETTRGIWPFGFELTLDAVAAGSALTVALTVRATGSEALQFMVALHLYLAVGEPQATTVTGLGDLPAEDNAADRAPVRLPAGPRRAVQRRDVAVRGVHGPVHVDDPVLGPLTLDADGFPDRVIWNPGSPSGLGDVPAGGEREFFCLEPAALTPVTLVPGAAWTGRVTLRA